MTHQESSECLNELAHVLIRQMGAGAVVLMALVADENGELALAVGSTGLPNTTRLLAKAMPDVATQLLAAADAQEPVRTGFHARVRGTNEN
jgi:uncharacterized membrane protein affecting hemolysin expression